MYNENIVTTRACTMGRLIETGAKKITLKSFLSDATRLWNTAPLTIKSCTTEYSAKVQIKNFVKTLPT